MTAPRDVFAEAHARTLLAYLLDRLRATARTHGYALGLHGSCARDVDLIAAPWTADAVDARTLIKALCDDIELTLDRKAWWLAEDSGSPYYSPQVRAHGRLAWSIYVTGCRSYLDVSVMPRVSSPEVG
jgi:hypothetical protein